MTRLYVRVSDEELGNWKKWSSDEGMLLSEWVRQTLNAAEPEVLQEYPQNKQETVRRVKALIEKEVKPVLQGLALCTECSHVKSKHGGFNGCCQADMCFCGGFKQ